MTDTPPAPRIHRATFLRIAAAGLGAGLVGNAVAADQPMPTRVIPSSGEPLPVVGLGTWRSFHVGASVAERAPLREVLETLFGAGGSLIDSSPMYGPAEQVVGDLLAAMAARQRAFIATKVWTHGREDGIRQMNESMRLLRVQRLDLMQVHNLVDWRTHLATLRDWQQTGRVRYLGVTHYTESGLDDLARVIEAERPDFVQFAYSIDQRAAERRLLPLAAELGVATIINRPFGGGGLFRRVRGVALPPWAGELGIESWGQFFLKFILSHPAVTCVIPGTGNPKHARDNVRAALGTLPDGQQRERMAEWLSQI